MGEKIGLYNIEVRVQEEEMEAGLYRCTVKVVDVVR